MAKHKIASISLTVRDRAILSKFSPTGYLSKTTLQFSENFTLFKNGNHFEFLPKMQNHKFASIALTVREQ